MYTIWLESPTGETLFCLADWLHLEYARSVNEVSPLLLVLPYTRTVWEAAIRDSRLLVYRTNSDGTSSLVTETCWFVRKRTRSIGKTTADTITLTAVCALDLMRRRIVAYDAGSAQANKSGPVDDLMAAIVYENFDLGATSERSLSLAYRKQIFWIDDSPGAGASIEKAFSHRNVLAVLKELSDASAETPPQIFFDVIAGMHWQYTHVMFHFKTYAQQRGMDRRSTAFRVSPDDGSLIDATYTEDWGDEITTVYAGGVGQGADRMIVERSNASRAVATPFNRIEQWIDSREYSSTGGLENEANTAVRRGAPRRTLTGAIQQTPTTLFGVHWNWGDYIIAYVRDVSMAVRIDAIRVTVDQNGHEDVAAYLRGEDDL